MSNRRSRADLVSGSFVKSHPAILLGRRFPSRTSEPACVGPADVQNQTCSPESIPSAEMGPAHRLSDLFHNLTSCPICGHTGAQNGGKVYGYSFEGTRHDAGDKFGMLKATVEFALKREDLGPDFRAYLKSLKL